MDAVNHPSHYEGHTSLECCDVMKLTFGKYHYFYFCLGNAFKYLWRHKHKNGKEDVLKAKWYLDKAETIYEEGQGSSLFLDDKENLDNMKEVFDKAVYSYSEGEEEHGRGTV